jgi:hypothetical protein
LYDNRRAWQEAIGGFSGENNERSGQVLTVQGHGLAKYFPNFFGGLRKVGGIPDAPATAADGGHVGGQAERAELS